MQAVVVTFAVLELKEIMYLSAVVLVFVQLVLLVCGMAVTTPFPSESLVLTTSQWKT